MSIMDKLFGTSAANQGTVAGPNGAQVAAPAVPVTNPVAATGNAAPAGGVTTEKKDDSPLADSSNFWQTPLDSAGKPIVHTDPLSLPVFNFDPAKIQAQARSLNFVSDVNSELLAEAVGQDGRVNPEGLLKLINSVQQNAFSAATLTMGKLVNDGMATHTDQLRKSLPTDFNRQQLKSIPVNEQYRDVLEHPAVKPLIGALRTAQFNKNPSANPTEIAASVDNLLIGLAEAMSATKTGATGKPGTGTSAQAQQAGNFDWESYFDGEGFGATATQ
jgi:hypothetical protein